MRIRLILALGLAVLAAPPVVQAAFYYRQVLPPEAGAASAPTPTQNTDAATGITVTVPCTSCQARSGSAVSFQPTASNTQGTVSWSLGAGALPAGTSISPSSGAVAGTAGAPSTTTFTARVTDSRGQPVDSPTVTFQVIPALAVSYAGSSGMSGRTLALDPTTSGVIGPASYAVTAGALPSGLSLDASTGRISGTVNATAVGIRVTATDSDGAAAASPAFDITNTDRGAISFANTSYSGRTGVNLSVRPTLTAMRANATLSIASGVIPAGMSFTSSTGEISGKPSIAGTSSNIVVQGPDVNGTTVRSQAIAITVAQPSIAYVPTTAYVGMPYSLAPTVTALNPPVTFSKVGGTLPPGLALNPSTGAVAGTPSAQGTFSGNLMTGIDQDLAQAYSNVFSIKVSPALTATFPATTVGRVGTPLSATATWTNFDSAPSWALTSGALPAGLSLAAASGTVSGTPTMAGDATSLVLTATQGSGSASTAPFTIRIVPPLSLSYPAATTLPRARPASIPATVAGTLGTPSFTLATGTLPTGMSVSASTGAIVGTPSVSGTTTGLQTRVTDGGSSLSNTFAITVADQTATMANGTARVGAYHSQLATSQLITSPNWELTVGKLPGGLVVQPSGVLEGTPTAATTASGLRMTATGTDGSATTPDFQVRVVPRLTLAAAADVSGTTGATLAAQAPSADGTVGTLTRSLLRNGADVSSSLGSLCPGLSFSAATGAISGTPTAACSLTLSYGVSDDGNGDASLTATATSNAFALAVAQATVTASVPSVSVTEGSTVAFSATTNVPNPAWSVSGNPAWMTFSSSNGTYSTSSVSADVSARQVYPVAISATGPSGTATATVTVTVEPAAATLPNAAARSLAAFSTPATETMDAPGSWTVTASPADVTGLAVSGTTLTGTAPSNAGPGAITRTLAATYAANVPPSAGATAAVTATPTLTVYPALTVADPADQSGVSGTATSFAAPAVGGKVGNLAYALLQGPADVSNSIGTTCPGLSFSTSSGAVSGTPTAACGATLAYRVTDDGAGNASAAATATSRTFALSVVAPSVTPSTGSVSAMEGDTVSFSATTSLTNPTWSVSGNPAWMAFSASNGTYATSSVSGNVTAATTYPVVLKATSGANVAQATVQVTVTPASATLATPDPVRSGGPFTAAVSETMAAPGTWSASASPADVTGLSVTGGTLSGTAPANAGTTALTRTLTATHTGPAPSSGPAASASATATLTVQPALAVAAPSDQGGQAGNALSFAAPAVTGRVGTLSYALLQGSTDVSSTLGTTCPGLSFSASTGAVSGTPSSSCGASLSYRVSDDGGGKASLAASATSAPFNFTVVPATATASTKAVGVTEGSPTSFSASTSVSSPTWTATGNPAWMTFTASNGTYATSSVSADVTATQTYSVTLTATGPSGSSTSSTVGVTVTAASATLADVTVRSGSAFTAAASHTMVAAGSWAASATAPDVTGLAFTGSTLSGTAPANAGPSPVTRGLTATRTATAAPSAGAAASASASSTLTVYPALTVAAPADRSGQTGSPLPFAAPAVGGRAGTLAYALVQGATNVSSSLGTTCPGLSFDTTTGAVSGTPTSACSATLAYRVTDDGGGTPALASSVTSPTFALSVSSATVTASAPSFTLVEGDVASVSATTSIPNPTWSVSGNPAWMTFTATNGTYATSSVSADVTASQTYAVVLKATGGGSSAQSTVTVTVSPASATLAGATVRSAAPFSSAVSHTMAAAGTWSATAAPADVTGLSVSGSTLSGTAPANTGTTAVSRTLTATRTASTAPTAGSAAAAAATATLTVQPALAVASPADQGGQAGTALSFAAPAVTGKVGALTYALLQGSTDVSSSLGTACPGLSFSTATGAVSGNPSSSCAATLAYRVTDDGGGNPSLAATATSATFSLTVVPATATASTPAVTVTEGSPTYFSASTSMTGATWTASGNPAWMTFAVSGGAYATSSVSPDVATTQNYTVTLTATGSSGATSTTTVGVTVNPATAAVADISARSGAAFATSVSKTMAAAGGWAVTSAADVTGLAVSGSTLSGTAPTVAGNAAVTRTLSGTYTATAAPSAGSRAAASGTGTLTVQPALTVAAPANRSGGTGATLAFAAPATGGQVGTLAYALMQGATDVSSTLGATCPGLSFSTSTGTVSGTPTSACSATLAYRVTDDGGGNASLAATATSQAFTLSVASATATASTNSVAATEGDTVSFSATTNVDTPTWSASGNPAWMAFTQSGTTYSTSSVSPDVSTTQSWNVTLTATGSSGAITSTTVAVTVSPASATLASASARSGGAFTAAVSETMTAPGAWTAASSPADVTGLSVSGTTLSGTAPTVTGTSSTRSLTATYTASSAPASGVAAAAVATSTLTVYPALSVAAPADQSGTAQASMNFGPPAVTGNVGTLTYALLQGGTDISSTVGTACNGLSFATTTGTVSGTPTASCSLTLSYRVSDAAGGNAGLAASATSATFALTVAGATVTPSTASVAIVEGDLAPFTATTTVASPTWSLSGQPAWMTFTSPSGRFTTNSVSGDVTATTTYPVVLKATSSTNAAVTAQSTVNVTVSPATVTLSPAAPVRASKAFSVPVSTTMPGTLTWTAASNPADVTGLAVTGGNLNGTAPANTTGAPISRTLTATATGAAVTSGTRASAAGSATVSVYPALTMATQAAKTGKVGVATSFGPTAVTGAQGNLSYALVQAGKDISDTFGTTCPGLAFDRASGTVSGTPTATCNVSLNYTVADDGGSMPTLAATASPGAAFGLSVTAVTVTASATYAVDEGGAASIQPTQTGATATVTWSVSSGTLPTGLSVSASTGAITGTPSARGTQPAFRVRATGSDGAYGDSQPITVTVTPAMAVRAVGPLQVGVAVTPTTGILVDTKYSYANNSNTPWQFYLDPSSDRLPLGVYVSFDGSYSGGQVPDSWGVGNYFNKNPNLFGTPLQAGTYTVRVVARNYNTRATITSDPVTFTVNPAPGAPLPILDGARNDGQLIFGYRTVDQKGVRLDPSDPLASTVTGANCAASCNGRRNLSVISPYRANAYGTANSWLYDSWYGNGGGGIYTGDYNIIEQVSQSAIPGTYSPVIYLADNRTGGTGRVGTWSPTVKVFNATTPKRAPVAFYTRTPGATSGSATINTTISAGDVIDIVHTGNIPVLANNLVPACGAPNTTFGPITYKVDGLLPDGTWLNFFTRSSSTCDPSGYDSGVIQGSVVYSNAPGSSMVTSRWRITVLSGSMPFQGVSVQKSVLWYASDGAQPE